MRCVGVRGGRNMFSYASLGSKSEISRLALTYSNLLGAFCLLGISLWTANTSNLCSRNGEKKTGNVGRRGPVIFEPFPDR
jgi:hypothetical protein